MEDDKVADIVVAMYVDKVANMVMDMEFDKVADDIANMVVDIKVDQVDCICVSTGYTLWCFGFGLN